jgi:hypothetical protein
MRGDLKAIEIESRSWGPEVLRYVKGEKLTSMWWGEVRLSGYLALVTTSFDQRLARTP